MMSTNKTTPKVKKNNTIIQQNNWYDYYAGFSDSFSIKYLKKYSRNMSNPLVLDPWAGSGTTNLAANYLNLSSVGFDINPIMIVVSKAKLFDFKSFDIEELKRIVSEENVINNPYAQDNDYLSHWFNNDSVAIIRSIESLIQNRILLFDNISPLKARDINSINSKVAFYYLILFKTVRSFSKSLTGSNPTWVRIKELDNKLSIKLNEFIDSFVNVANSFFEHRTTLNNRADFFLNDSKNLPIEKNSVDIILTSPPYCTRIDYAVSTIIELALIGYNQNEIDELRASMIGTPKILAKGTEYLLDELCSSKAKSILTKIKKHKSKAAESYYFKTYYQYFYFMQQSIKNLSEVVKPNGIVMIVIQDSYFKDIYINLKQCIVEMFEYYGYVFLETKAFKATNNIRSINSNSRKYKDSVKVYERIIVLRKG